VYVYITVNYIINHIVETLNNKVTRHQKSRENVIIAAKEMVVTASM